MSQGVSPSKNAAAGGQSVDMSRLHLTQDRRDSPPRSHVSIAASAQTLPIATHLPGHTHIPSKIPDDMRIVKQVSCILWGRPALPDTY